MRASVDATGQRFRAPSPISTARRQRRRAVPDVNGVRAVTPVWPYLDNAALRANSVSSGGDAPSTQCLEGKRVRWAVLTSGEEIHASLVDLSARAHGA